MVAFPPLIVVSNFTNAPATIEQGIFQIVFRWFDRGRNPPDDQFHDGAIVVIDAFLEQQLSLHLKDNGHSSHMVSIDI